MSHYDIEDEPKADVDNSLAMYEQSKKVVADAKTRSEALLGEVEPVLESLYNMASHAQDIDLLVAVNSAWEKTQQLAQIIEQQDSALNGADVVIGVVKSARDAALDELNKIIKGLDEGDTSWHPKLEKFREEIEELTNEWVYEDAMDSADETISEQFAEVLEPLVGDYSMTVTFSTVSKFLGMLRGDYDMNPEQEKLIRELLATCLPSSVVNRAPIEEAEDYEDDEDED